MTNRDNTDADLLARFIATFEIFDDLCDFLAPAALVSQTDEHQFQFWQPRQITTSRSAFESIYLKLPARFPPLYEALILSYRWASVELCSTRLLPNEPADDFSPLLKAITRDSHLYSTLVSSGYLQFGQGPDKNYDPVCFDFRHRAEIGDMRIVQLDHEEILCYGRIREVKELAPSFRALVLNTVNSAELKRNRAIDARDSE
jgi:hypothetical protein